MPTSAPTETSLESGNGDGPLRGQSPSPGRFIPGTVLAKRYRVIALLGRGGMGEVYRADDLKLGQPVALKFLPEAVQRDPARLERFLNEVKVALKVTHPNVCRVYDIGEIPSTGLGRPSTGSPSTSSGLTQHYISMEYVDGEDLASLLRRIGRLPQDKAVQIARQLCAGVAAAHEQGILHRDLKPANVMIDGRGRAKITDFGLASLAEGIEGEEVRAGTPAYMAPEQLAGKEVTVRSDLYSLGLVVYELFTGKRAFDASTAAELRRLHEESTPTSPSSHVEGLDPAVERSILRCLERDSADRPGSALAVAAALPGGDPLAAALAAGETPSPEVVAAAGGEGTVHPGVGAACFVGVLVLMAVVIFMYEQTSVLRYVSMEKHPEVLADRAREILSDLGIPGEAADSAHGFYSSYPYIRRYVEVEDDSPDRWEVLTHPRPAAVAFWYRQSSRNLVPWRPLHRVGLTDPPADSPGMVSIDLDLKGRLHYLNAQPESREEAPETVPETDWSVLFEAAGLDLSSFEPAEPKFNFPIRCDENTAWEGVYPERPDVPMWIEACAFRGTPRFFFNYGPWHRTPDEFRRERQWVEKIARVLQIVLPLLVSGIAVSLAVRNLRVGRGDRRGATRLAALVFACMLAAWVIAPDHLSSKEDLDRLKLALASSVLWGAIACLSYLALEPFVRRRWPSMLVSWSRLLAGRIRDPRVGRDVLVGLLLGASFHVLNFTDRLVGSWLGVGPPFLDTTVPEVSGVRRMMAFFLDGLPALLFATMGVVLGLVVLRTILRRQWLAVGVLGLVMMAVFTWRLNEPFYLSVALNALMTSLLLFCLLRYGLLTTISMVIAGPLLGGAIALTTDLSAWYATPTIAAYLLIGALALYGFLVSLPRGAPRN